MERQYFSVGFVVVALACLGCGASSSGGESGGKTNWLSPCERDADCRSLEDAVCNDLVCTPRCDVEHCDAGTPPGTEAPEDPEKDAGPFSEDPATDSSEDPATDSSEGSEPPAPDLVELCDGSDEIRFFTTTGGGFVDEYFGFYGRYGHSFLAIDGQCRYWVSERAGGSVRTGAIDPMDAREYAASLHFGVLDAFAGYSGEGCPDGGTTILRDPSGESSCFCRCDGPDAPSGYAAAYAAARGLVQNLFALGEEYLGPARLLIVLDDTLMPLGSGVPWPLEFDPMTERFEYDPGAGSEQVNPDVGLLIDDAGELEALRAARQLWYESNEYRIYMSPHLHMTRAYGESVPEAHFRVFMSDELPARVLAEF